MFLPIRHATEMKELCRGTYQILGVLGHGSFGTIYKVVNRKSKKEYAAKVEYKNAEHIQIKEERDAYTSLPRNAKGYLRMKEYFSGPRYRCLILTLVGSDLESLLRFAKLRRFPLKTVLMLAIQLLEHVETLHKACFVHRDIKPENLAMGLGDESPKLFMLDLGLGKRYTYGESHIMHRKDEHLTGTARYASLHAHEGEELSRRDDLESIAYVLIYLSKGKLPWQGLRSDYQGSKYENVYKMKKKTTINELCKNLEPEFAEFLKYARSLEFTDKPDYAYCKQLFRNVMTRKMFDMDYIYCWTKPTDKAAVDKCKSDRAKTEKKWREKEIRMRKTAQERRKIDKRRPRPYAPIFSDSLFPIDMPLEQRRAIIVENMRTGPLPSAPMPYPQSYPFALPFPLFNTVMYNQPPPNHDYNTSNFLF